jgi:hypothetical protein
MAQGQVHEVPTAPIGWRIAITAVGAVVTIPALFINLYVLMWFAPEFTTPGACDFGSWWFRYDGTFAWVAVAVIGLAAPIVLLGLTTARLFRARRWWPWSAALAAVAVAAYLLPGWLSSTSWCPAAF